MITVQSLLITAVVLMALAVILSAIRDRAAAVQVLRYILRLVTLPIVGVVYLLFSLILVLWGLVPLTFRTVTGRAPSGFNIKISFDD